jgi:hypothetical protein
MGRPHLYHSPEKRLAASRAKSKKHYQQYIFYSQQLEIWLIKTSPFRNEIQQQRQQKYCDVQFKKYVGLISLSYLSLATYFSPIFFGKVIIMSKLNSKHSGAVPPSAMQQ